MYIHMCIYVYTCVCVCVSHVYVPSESWNPLEMELQTIVNYH